jgi:hypothetical protein
MFKLNVVNERGVAELSTNFSRSRSNTIDEYNSELHGRLELKRRLEEAAIATNEKLQDEALQAITKKNQFLFARKTEYGEYIGGAREQLESKALIDSLEKHTAEVGNASFMSNEKRNPGALQEMEYITARAGATEEDATIAAGFQRFWTGTFGVEDLHITLTCFAFKKDDIHRRRIIRLLFVEGGSSMDINRADGMTQKPYASITFADADSDLNFDVNANTVTYLVQEHLIYDSRVDRLMFAKREVYEIPEEARILRNILKLSLKPPRSLKTEWKLAGNAIASSIRFNRYRKIRYIEKGSESYRPFQTASEIHARDLKRMPLIATRRMDFKKLSTHERAQTGTYLNFSDYDRDGYKPNALNRAMTRANTPLGKTSFKISTGTNTGDLFNRRNI